LKRVLTRLTRIRAASRSSSTRRLLSSECIDLRLQTWRKLLMLTRGRSRRVPGGRRWSGRRSLRSERLERLRLKLLVLERLRSS
jgi:hypothetical protein